ncbi:MAG: hypothetical protein J5J00_04180, partial [Deltaproteobacteria bacterium]|nr:hypothetical protein [Deltaproteobacteria bacterium]
MKRAQSLLIVLLGLFFIGAPAPAKAEKIFLWAGQFSVEFLGSSYDGTDTMYSYKVCTVDEVPMQGFSHIVFGVPDCSPDLVAHTCSPSNCEIG